MNLWDGNAGCALTPLIPLGMVWMDRWVRSVEDPRLAWDCAAVLINAWKGSWPLGKMILFLNECEKLEVIIPRKDFSLSCFWIIDRIWSASEDPWDGREESPFPLNRPRPQASWVRHLTAFCSLCPPQKKESLERKYWICLEKLEGKDFG